MKLYVGNVDFNATEDQLTGLFAEHGEVNSVKIITDRMTGRSKGFAFVEMLNDSEAKAAMEALNGYEMNRRPIAVSEARPREEGGNGGGGSNRGGGGYGNNRGGGNSGGYGNRRY